VSTADDSLVQALFRALHAAERSNIGRIDIEAATTDGVAGLTIMAMPTQLADYVGQQLASFTVIDIGRQRP
jgi:hypothetical protein